MSRGAGGPAVAGDVELPTTDRRAPASDVVVFDIMRESLTTVLGDYVVLIQRAQDAGDDQESDRLMKIYVELEAEADGVNPRDRDEQTAMTRRLRDLHADLQTAIHPR